MTGEMANKNLTDRIEGKLQSHFKGGEISLVNESHMHAGLATESHFKITLVSDDFIGLSLVQRHRLIYQLLGQEMRDGVHALALHLYTGEERQKVTTSPDSPLCAGAKRKD